MVPRNWHYKTIATAGTIFAVGYLALKKKRHTLKYGKDVS